MVLLRRKTSLVSGPKMRSRILAIFFNVSAKDFVYHTFMMNDFLFGETEREFSLMPCFDFVM